MEKYLGLDLGTVTLGIAKSDSLGFVHGVETFRFTKGQYSKARERVHQLVKELDIKNVVLGLPITLHNEEGEASQRSLRFKEDLLKEDSSLNIIMVDERLTSVSANKLISEMNMSHKQRKDSVDRIAACEILDIYIRRLQNNG